MDLRESEYTVGSVCIQRIRWDGTMVPGEHAAVLERSRRNLIQAEREHRWLITLLDFGPSFVVDAKHRRYQAEWNRHVEELVRATTLGQAFIVPSVVFRGIITAVFWIAPPPVPHVVCDSLDSAVTWALRMCAPLVDDLPELVRDECRMRLDALQVIRLDSGANDPRAPVG